MEIDIIALRAALYKWLQSNPMTMTELAEHIGISQLTLARFRNEKRVTSMKTVFKVTKFLREKGLDSWDLRN